MPRKKQITLVANMMIRDDDIPYLDATIPQLHEMCERLVLMYNGPTRNNENRILYLMKPEDNLLIHVQDDPPNYSKMRNIMLEETPQDVWVIRWDPDELPTNSGTGGGLIALADYITRHVPDGATKVATPCFHMVRDREALAVEYGYAHVRAFKYDHGVEWRGNVHENLHCPGTVHTIPLALGMASVHFSYYSEKRLRRKERQYAKVPGSGHGPGTLTANIGKGLREIPPNIEWQAPDGWLEKVKELD